MPVPSSFWKWLIGLGAEVLAALLIAVLLEDDENDKPGRAGAERLPPRPRRPPRP